MPSFGLTGIVIAVLTLGACAQIWPETHPWPGQDPYVPETSYCYITLAKPDCFDAPVPGQAYRQVGRAINAPH